jgi:FkbM family methyltransferase
MTDYIQTTIDGLTLYIREGGQRQVWDEGIIKEVQQYPIGDGPFRRVLDIGAHIGAFSCWMHSKYPEAIITCVEADFENYLLLMRNVPFASVILGRAGYDTRDAWVYRTPDNTGGNCIVYEPERFPAERLLPAPPRVALEDIIGAGVDLLKVDIEGSEYDLFSHCEDESLKRIRRIVGERHGTHEHFMEQIGNRLEQFFTVTDLGHASGVVLDLGTFIAERK